uniref:Uncharacterized protein n=1 Tax=Oryza brachyantha TaxID=4533 RepID=J3MB01_ORYBR
MASCAGRPGVAYEIMRANGLTRAWQSAQKGWDSRHVIPPRMLTPLSASTRVKASSHQTPTLPNTSRNIMGQSNGVHLKFINGHPKCGAVLQTWRVKLSVQVLQLTGIGKGLLGSNYQIHGQSAKLWIQISDSRAP